jgi:hypothetical protein
LHLHTSYSFDSYLDAGTKVDPDKAYRFAKGEAVNYRGQPAQRREPLDFLAVTDHIESIGVLTELDDPNSSVSRSECGKQLRALLALLTRSDGSRNPAIISTMSPEGSRPSSAMNGRRRRTEIISIEM